MTTQYFRRAGIEVATGQPNGYTGPPLHAHRRARKNT